MIFLISEQAQKCHLRYLENITRSSKQSNLARKLWPWQTGWFKISCNYYKHWTIDKTSLSI